MTMTVHAAVARGANTPLTIETVELRALGPGEALVAIKASGLCHTDLSVIEGNFVLPKPFPLILGHEGAGIVMECGPGVVRVKPGDHVVVNNLADCGACEPCLSDYTNYCVEMSKNRDRLSPFSSDGSELGSMSRGATFATHTVLDEIYLTPIPKHIAFESACLIGCGVMTGVGSVINAAKMRRGSTAVVLGMGSIGLSVVQAAKLAGARRVLAVDTNPTKEAAARLFGATDFVNPKTLEVPLLAHIPTLLGALADYSFECVGHTDLQRQALAIVNPFWGVCIATGIPPASGKIELAAASFYYGRTLRGTLLGDGKPHRDVPRIIDWYLNGQLRLDELVTHRLELGQINHGFDLMKRGEAIRVVIVR